MQDIFSKIYECQFSIDFDQKISRFSKFCSFLIQILKTFMLVCKFSRSNGRMKAIRQLLIIFNFSANSSLFSQTFFGILIKFPIFLMRGCSYAWDIFSTIIEEKCNQGHVLWLAFVSHQGKDEVPRSRIRTSTRVNLVDTKIQDGNKALHHRLS